MRLFIRYLRGYGQEAILLATMENRIRVAAPGRDDAMEFRFVEGHWISETLEPVEIEEHPELDIFGWSSIQFDATALASLRGIDLGVSLMPAQPPASAPTVN